MANKVIKTRMQQKHDISENWAKAKNFSPLIGEIIVYDDLNKFKIGDGKTNVNDLPFTGVGNSGTGNSSTVLNSDENKALTAFSAASGYKTVAGKKAFKITAMPSRTSFVLDSVEGLAVGDVVSYSIPQSGSGTSSVSWKETQDIAKITAISAKTITLDAAIPNNLAAADIANYQSSTNRIACRLWVNAKPEIGTYDLSTKANARGRENKALGEASDVGGKGNIVTAPYGAATNSGNKVDAENGFAFGGGNTLEQSAKRSAIGGVNNTGKAYATFLGGNQSEAEETARESIGWGMGLKLTNPNEAVVGRYNEPKAGLLFSAGNGTGEDNRHNAFEVYDDGNISTQGDIKRVAYATIENQTGWVKFAEYSFAAYKQGGALLNFKQTYVGSKYNALVELEINTIDKGFHADEGIVFRQLAGKDITDKIGYIIEPTTHNISFYVYKEQYEYIYVNLLSDTFGGYMKYYTNEPIEANTPSFTAKLSNSVLGATKNYVDTKFGAIDLSDYYTKSQVDTKVANTFKYKGTFISPMVIPKTGFAPGDVYNCAWGGYIPNYFYNSKEITSIVFNEPTATSNLSLTITFSEPIGTPEGGSNYISPYRIGLQLEGNPAGALIGTVNWNADGSFKDQTTITVTPTLQDKGHDEKIPNIRPFNDFMSYILSHTGPFNTTVFNVKENIGSTGVSQMYVDDGCDVVYTGDTWDSLGSNFNPNNYYTTSQVDDKIAASGGTGDPNTVIISSAADFSTSQTFTNKTIKIAANIDLPANSTITFNNCIIHGLSKNTTITTYGDNLTFTNCNIYDLTILGIGDSSTSSLNVKLTLTNCKLNNCGIYGSSLHSSFLSDCTFVNCSYSTPATGIIYFSGNTTFIGGSITQTDGNGSLMLVKNSRTFINGTNINMEITGTTLFKNEITGTTSSLSLIGCYEKNNKTINIAADITTIPVLATLNTLNFTPITQVQE